jgi:predicted AAA+ superfamily ATPase
LPTLFPALRVAVDAQRGAPGRFVITGSSSPELLRDVSESLAGRVGIIELAPFSFTEALGRPVCRFAEMIIGGSGPADFAALRDPTGGVAEAHEFWLWGGYPEPWLRRDLSFRKAWLEQYLQTYLYRDVGRLFPGLDQPRFRQFLALLGGLSGAVINYAEVARALSVSQPTARDYFEIAHGTFVWRRLPPFVRNPVKRLVKHAKGYLRDSGLAHHLLRVADRDALLAHPQAGATWEGMVIEEIIRQFRARGAPCEAYYYRTAAGAEVDLVLEGDFGLVPVEIKRATTWPGRRRALRDFIADYRCRQGFMIHAGERPERVEEQITAVPFTYL